MDKDSTVDQPVDETPTITCSRCNREWTLHYELEELYAGNRAVEQFALDHERHTGHFPDEITPWIVSCQQCPDSDRYLEERPARRWAKTHVRHTDHTVEIRSPIEEDSPELIDFDYQQEQK
ncbi:hypothetical protein [Haloquadratum walsbyi]|jgi:hypothetical protein|uniref:Uncharacterized protein n=1 Tax=Haloquadratum walsbyi (strain DSM 16854 / JCM 12705 / C23) TaxID=768065 RepID=G0LJ74_HALWC|nr:hypothetical protein [Haloquadratum walsbyi]CCC40642.1 uncharacterized protein Hqrw_2830 [Haloquadratum walsbyi C23]